MTGNCRMPLPFCRGMGPCMGMLLLPLTSLAVITLMTPGISSASEVSMLMMLAW